MNELQVKANLTPGVIKFNFEEIREQVQSIADAYKDATFHEDTCKEAKASVSTLRKIRKAINDRKIEVKKEYNTPYTDFENKVKDLFEIIDEPIENINKQVKEFDEKERKKKRERINGIFEKLPEAVKEVLDLETIFNQKWLNKGYLTNEIQKELEDYSNKIQSDLSVIQSMKSDVEEKAIQKYKNNLDLAIAIQFINDDKERKEEIIRKQKEEEDRKEAERIRQEERAKIAQTEKIEEVANEVANETQQAVIQSVTPEQSGNMEEYTYKIKLSKAGKQTFEMYMNSVGIEFDEQVEAWI